MSIRNSHRAERHANRNKSNHYQYNTKSLEENTHTHAHISWPMKRTATGDRRHRAHEIYVRACVYIYGIFYWDFLLGGTRRSDIIKCRYNTRKYIYYHFAASSRNASRRRCRRKYGLLCRASASSRQAVDDDDGAQFCGAACGKTAATCLCGRRRWLMVSMA